MPLQRVVDRHPCANEPFAVIDQQPQIELRPIEVRGRQRLKPFAQRRPGDSERVDAVGLAAPAGLAPRSGRQRAVNPQVRVRRARSETAPTSSRHAGNPRSPTRVPRPNRAPHASKPAAPLAPDRTVCSPNNSPDVADTAAIVCERLGRRHGHDHCLRPPPSRTELDAQAGHGVARGRCALLLAVYAQASTTGDERHSERRVETHPADSAA